MGRNGADLGVDRAHWRWATAAVAGVGLLLGLWLITKLISGWDCRFWKDSHEICPSNSDMTIGVTLTLGVLAGSLLSLRSPLRRSPGTPSHSRALVPETSDVAPAATVDMVRDRCAIRDAGSVDRVHAG